MVDDRLKKMLELKKAFECVAITAPTQMRQYYRKVADDVQDIIINEAKLLLLENQSEDGTIRYSHRGLPDKTAEWPVYSEELLSYSFPPETRPQTREACQIKPESWKLIDCSRDKSKKSNVRQTLHGNPQRTFRSYVRQTEEVLVREVRLSRYHRNKDHQKNPIDPLLNP